MTFKKTISALTVALGVTLAGNSVAAIKAPDVSGVVTKPERAPYPDDQDAQLAFKAAKAKAIKENKFLLLDFGANWCPDCRVLSGALNNEKIHAWIEKNFVPVLINVDHLDSNMDIAASYGVHIKAIPTVLVISPKGKLLNKDATLSLGEARSMSAQKMVDLLASWANRYKLS